MAKAVKYQYDFKTFDGHSVIVRFFYEGHTGGIRYIDPGMKAFVLREFNSDADFFKPIRPFQAEMEVLATPNLQLEDFIMDNDDDIQVQVEMDGALIWIGWLLQDDYNGPWISSNHIITLKASDGLGQIGADPVNILVGQDTMESFIAFAIDSSPIPSFIGTTIVNRLFYDGMDDAANKHPLSQCTVDGKTFEGDDNNKIIDKVNRAWSQTLYQYLAKWWIVRQEEFLHPGNVDGVVRGTLSDTSFSKSFEASVGLGETIKPIAPDMQRYFRRSYKRDKIRFLYEFPNELICNQFFNRGTLIDDTDPDFKTYSIDCWTLYKSSFGTPVAGDATWYRKEELDADGNVTDDYSFIDRNVTLHYIKSTGLRLGKDEMVKISFDYRVNASFPPVNGPANVRVAAILFETASAKYTLDNDGTWVQSNSSYTTFFKYLNMSYSSIEDLTIWKTFEVQSKAVPGPGVMYVCFVSTNVTYDANHKGLAIEIKEPSYKPGVIGDYDQYERTNNIKQNYNEQTFLDDSNNVNHKGAIHFSGNLTGDNWYRQRFDTERLTFKRHKAIAHMLLDRRTRLKLDVNMLGLTYMDGSTERMIGLMNRFRFVDDAPDKLFMILNLKEMDFVNGTWSATLLEVWDDVEDDDDPAGYPAHSFANIYEGDRN